MKLKLNQLQIDSYAAQLTVTELTQIKGGTTVYCFYEDIQGGNFIEMYPVMHWDSEGVWWWGHISIRTTHTQSELEGGVHESTTPIPGITGIPPR